MGKMIADRGKWVEFIKRLFAFLMTAMLLGASFNMNTYGADLDGFAQAEVGEDFSMAYVNPIYADILTETDLLRPEDLGVKNVMMPQELCEGDGSCILGEGFAAERGYRLNSPLFASLEEASAYLREEMVKRNESIAISIKDQAMDFSTLAKGIVNRAMEHTGAPKEGDYLKYQYGGWRCTAGKKDAVYTISYIFTYYTSAEQEREVDEKIDELLPGILEVEMDAYQKLCSIYDYVSEAVTYDYDHLNDEDYKLKFSAYDALINGTAVCQGYSALLYRLLLECGINCRIISGTGNGGPHAWNIVGMTEKYYNVDVTWESSYKKSGCEHYWFMKKDGNFENHIREDDYLSEEFQKAYPMAESDFDYTSWLAEKTANNDIDSGNEEKGDDVGNDEGGISIVKGASNNDGAVNRADRMYLARAIAGWEGYELPSGDIADFNGDGDVNRADRIYLARAIAGWEGYSVK